MSTFDDIINQMANLYNVPSLISAVINQGQILPQSPKGAMGLMQLMPGTFAKCSRAEIRGIRQITFAQALSIFRRCFQCLAKCLLLLPYNSGPGTVKKWRDFPIKRLRIMCRVMSYSTSSLQLILILLKLSLVAEQRSHRQQ